MPKSVPHAPRLAWGLQGSEKLKKRMMEGLLNGVASFTPLSFFSAKATAITPWEQEKKKESSNVMENYRVLDVIERPPRNILKLRMGGGCSFQGFSIKLWRVRAFPTEDGGMPVDAADPLVLGVLLVCEGLVEHQALRGFTSPVASFHLDSQKSPVVVKHVHDLTLLKGLDDPAEVNSPTVMHILFSSLFFFLIFKVCLKMCSWRPRFTWGSSCGRTSSHSAAAGGFLSLWR